MIAKMSKSKNISMETLVRICEALNCGILDVIELEKDGNSDVTMIIVIGKVGLDNGQLTRHPRSWKKH